MKKCECSGGLGVDQKRKTNAANKAPIHIGNNKSNRTLTPKSEFQFDSIQQPWNTHSFLEEADMAATKRVAAATATGRGAKKACLWTEATFMRETEDSMIGTRERAEKIDINSSESWTAA